MKAKILTEFLCLWRHCRGVSLFSLLPLMPALWFLLPGKKTMQPKVIDWKQTWRKSVKTTVLIKNVPFIMDPQREAPAGSSRAQMSYSIMQYVFLADSVSRELPDKMGCLDKLCGGIMHVHWVMNSMWLWDTSSSHSPLTSSQSHYRLSCALTMCACKRYLLFLSILLHNATVEECVTCCTCSVWLRLFGKIWGCCTSARALRLHF